MAPMMSACSAPSPDSIPGHHLSIVKDIPSHGNKKPVIAKKYVIGITSYIYDWSLAWQS